MNLSLPNSFKNMDKENNRLGSLAEYVANQFNEKKVIIQNQESLRE